MPLVDGSDLTDHGTPGQMLLFPGERRHAVNHRLDSGFVAAYILT